MQGSASERHYVSCTLQEAPELQWSFQMEMKVVGIFSEHIVSLLKVKWNYDIIFVKPLAC